MTDIEYRRAMLDAAEIAAQKVLVSTGQLKPYMSLRQAYKLYGERNVERWRREGLIKAVKDGDRNSKVRIDRLEIESVARTSNRASYFEHSKE